MAHEAYVLAQQARLLPQDNGCHKLRLQGDFGKDSLTQCLAVLYRRPWVWMLALFSQVAVDLSHVQVTRVLSHKKVKAD